MKPNLVFVLALLMSATHFFAYRIKALRRKPRSRWLSMAGGSSVAYIFIHLLPEIAAGQATVVALEDKLFSWLRHHLYILSLLGLCVFYGLERYAKFHKRKPSGNRVFWLHLSSFALYNLLIGYLFVNREDPSISNLLFFFVAMTLHFLVNDYGLLEAHQDIYISQGRWILSLSILLGWLTGVLVVVPEPFLLGLMAFLAGGVILNTLKEELPEERESRYWAFFGGALLYSALLLAAGSDQA